MTSVACFISVCKQPATHVVERTNKSGTMRATCCLDHITRAEFMLADVPMPDSTLVVRRATVDGVGGR